MLRRVGWDVEANGLFGAPPIRVLIGEEAHATVFSALQFLGFGHDRVRPRRRPMRRAACRPTAFERAIASAMGRPS